jgi:hypothetical protein
MQIITIVNQNNINRRRLNPPFSLNKCSSQIATLMALGELIIEERGKITGERVLDVQVPKMETSFTVEGNYKGKISFRGSLFFKVPPTFEGGKLSDLNNIMGVFEYEVDETGNCSVKVWEWK